MPLFSAMLVESNFPLLPEEGAPMGVSFISSATPVEGCSLLPGFFGVSVQLILVCQTLLIETGNLSGTIFRV